jgi:hypothetical protein
VTDSWWEVRRAGKAARERHGRREEEARDLVDAVGGSLVDAFDTSQTMKPTRSTWQRGDLR